MFPRNNSAGLQILQCINTLPAHAEEWIIWGAKGKTVSKPDYFPSLFISWQIKQVTIPSRRCSLGTTWHPSHTEISSLHWYHKSMKRRLSVSNERLITCLFKLTTQKTPKLRITGHFVRGIHRWSAVPLTLQMDKPLHPILYNEYNYLSMLRLKLIYASKMDSRCPSCRFECCQVWLVPQVVGDINNQTPHLMIWGCRFISRGHDLLARELAPRFPMKIIAKIFRHHIALFLSFHSATQWRHHIEIQQFYFIKSSLTQYICSYKHKNSPR